MTTYKKLCENVADAWLISERTGDDTQFAEALEAWALKNAYDSVTIGFCTPSDIPDIKQEFITRFLVRAGESNSIGLRLKYAAHDVRAGFDSPSSPVSMPSYKTAAETRDGKPRNSERCGVRRSSIEFDPSTMDHAVEHDGFAEVELRDEVNAVKAAIKDTELEELWDKCIELGGDPVAIRREFGQYQGNLILEKLRKYLVTKTNIVEPNTVRDCYG